MLWTVELGSVEAYCNTVNIPDCKAPPPCSVPYGNAITSRSFPSPKITSVSRSLSSFSSQFSLPPSFPFLRTSLSLLTFPFPPSLSLFLSLVFLVFTLFKISTCFCCFVVALFLLFLALVRGNKKERLEGGCPLHQPPLTRTSDSIHNNNSYYNSSGASLYPPSIRFSAIINAGSFDHSACFSGSIE